MAARPLCALPEEETSQQDHPDLDSTDDHTHGQQEFSFYHGYYRNHILHPLLIFDADTGDLVCAVLRPGNKGAASHIVPILKRVVEAIRQAVGPGVEIEIRADSGFATPRLRVL